MSRASSMSALAAGFAVATLLLSGCNSGGSVAKQTVITKTATVTAQATNETPAAEQTPESAPTSTDDTADDSSGTHVLKFGDTYKFQGWSVSVSAPKPYTPSEYAASDHKHPVYRLMTVTVTNTSSNKAVNANIIDVSAQVGEVEGDEVFDGTVGSVPNASVLPGRSVSWKIAYGAKVGDQITVQVSDSGSYDGPVAAFDGKVS